MELIRVVTFEKYCQNYRNLINQSIQFIFKILSLFVNMLPLEVVGEFSSNFSIRLTVFSSLDSMNIVTCGNLASGLLDLKDRLS